MRQPEDPLDPRGRPTLFAARWVVVDPEHLLEHAAVLVRGGEVEAVLTSRGGAAARAARRVDLGPVALTPGLVNAHAHLELGGLAGRLPARPGDAGFLDWVRALVALRRSEDPAALEAATIRGADQLLTAGCTSVGDIDTTGAAERALRRHPIRAVVHRELLDLGDPDRRAAALKTAARRPVRSRRQETGYSPHAPYSAGHELLAAVAALARRRRAALAIHWAETVAEGDWLERGEGPFGDLFGPVSPRVGGLDSIEAAGLLGPRLALVHGNDPRRDEVRRIGRSGATLVHCPGTHAYFARPPFPLAAYREHGVTLALGTDSLASNEALDPRREMLLARRAFPGLEAREIWRWATEGGARALGQAQRVGSLRPGAQADLVARSTSARTPGELWDELTAGLLPVRGVWIAGRAVTLRGAAAPCSPPGGAVRSPGGKD